MGRSEAGQRMFVALVPPESAIEDLDEFLAPRRSAAAFRWSMAEQFHLTLAFCDSVADYRLEALVDGLEQATRRRTPFDAWIAGGGAFPDPSRGRILYAGVQLDDVAAAELDLLARGCRTAAARAGIDVDGQRFRPHVTLARLNRPTELTSWVRLMDTYRGPTWIADRIALLASYLGEGPHGRPRYETITHFPLTK